MTVRPVGRSGHRARFLPPAATVAWFRQRALRTWAAFRASTTFRASAALQLSFAGRPVRVPIPLKGALAFFVGSPAGERLAPVMLVSFCSSDRTRVTVGRMPASASSGSPRATLRE